jgi:tetratricopeptide (TPR) repeat protein
VDWTLHLHSRLRRGQLLAERRKRIAPLIGAQPLVAEAQLRRLVELGRQHLGDSHRVTRSAMVTLGILQRSLGRYDESIEVLDSVIAQYDPTTRSAVLWLAQAGRAATKIEMGQFEEAERELRAVLDAAGSLMGDRGLTVFLAREFLAVALHKQDRRDEAIAELTDAIAVRSRQVGPDDRLTQCARHVLGHVLIAAGEIDRAEAEFTAVTDHAAAAWRCKLDCEHGFARIAAARGHREDAIRGYEWVVQGWIDFLGPDTVRADRAREHLAELTGSAS